MPTISNNISLCKLHHAAFDQFMIGISPDYKIQVREDILHEEDGTMLLHGLQGLHGASMMLPVRNVDQPALDWRYQGFLQLA